MTTDRDSTNARLVTTLRRGPATMDDLTAELGLTRTAVRLQLAALERKGLVTRSGLRRGRTKPSRTYALTDDGEQALSRAYVPVLRQLLDVLSERLAATELDDVMRAVGRRLGAGQARPRGSLRDRVETASDFLQDLGGLTEVHDEAGGGLLIQSHGCPLAATAADHAETCAAMESLVSEMVNADVLQRCDRADRPRCRFYIADEADPDA